MKNQEQHEKMLYCICRVRTDKAGGSGTIIYSKPKPKSEDEYETFILTNHHVIEGALSYKEEWDSVIHKDIKKEFRSPVSVEIFDYINGSTVNSINAYRADIVAYDSSHDLAVLCLDTPRPLPYVGTLIPRDNIKDLRIYTPTITCGCSLGHDPFPTSGWLTGLKEIIDNKQYLMASNTTIFGNSGGALFVEETGELIGVTSRITAIQLGFGIDIMTWMGFSAAPQRIYEFIDEQELKFLYDPKDTYEKALERRKKKEEKMRMLMARDDDEDKKGEG